MSVFPFTFREKLICGESSALNRIMCVRQTLQKVVMKYVPGVGSWAVKSRVELLKRIYL